MYKPVCNYNCKLKTENNSDLKIDKIKWINLNKRHSNLMQKKHESINYTLIKDLFYIEKIQNFAVLYAPLLIRLYIVPLKMLKSYKDEIIFKHEYLDDLIRSGLYLSDETQRNINMQTNKKISISKNLRLAFSSGCNLNCQYCYADPNREGKKFNIDSLENFINSLPENFEFSKIELHGNGEPTYNFKNLKNVIEFFQKKYPGIKFVVQSNGQFDEKVAEWLYKNKIKIGFSFDGPEYIQDKQRPCYNTEMSSFKKIMNNLEYFIKKGEKPGLISTITRYSLPYMETIYAFFKDLSIRSLLLNPLIEAGRADQTRPSQNIYSTSCDLEEFAVRYTGLLKTAFQDGISLRSRMLFDIMSNPKSFRCEAAHPKFVLLPSNDIVSCCETLEMTGITCDNPFVFGKLENQSIKYFKDNIKKLQYRSSTNINECKDCQLKWICSGGCLAESYIRNSDINKPVDEYCKIRLKISQDYFNYLADQMYKNYLMI